MARLALDVQVAEAAGIRVDQADLAIDAALDGFGCVIHTEDSTLNGKPQPQDSTLNSKPQPQDSTLNSKPQPQDSTLNGKPQPQERCRRREDLVLHIAKAAGIGERAAGIALALVLQAVDDIARDAGVRSVYEFKP